MLKTFWTSTKSCSDNKLKFIIIVLGVYLNTPLVLCRAKMDNRNSGVVYYIDHEVSEKNAKLVYKDLRNKLLSNATKSPWCNECTNEDVAYCLGKKMLHDHCCCDQKHGEDQLSWVPHTCYISHDQCVPYMGSCVDYSTIRLCCCDKILAEHLYPSDGASHVHGMSHNYYIPILAPIIYHLATL